jgi:hypothetical protein
MFSKSIVSFSSLFFIQVLSFQARPSTTNKRYPTNLMSSWTPNSSEQRSLSNELSISPLDQYNAALLNEVRPLEYNNPEVGWGTVWDLVVVGAGAGGLVSSRQVC